MTYEYSFEQTRKFDVMCDDGKCVLDSYDIRITIKDMQKNDMMDLRSIIEEFCD